MEVGEKKRKRRNREMKGRRREQWEKRQTTTTELIIRPSDIKRGRAKNARVTPTSKHILNSQPHQVISYPMRCN